jgi:hypothetical protein
VILPSRVNDLKHFTHSSWPLWWFARLESALESGNLKEAAEAQLKLEQLGLRVEPIAPWQEGGAYLGD